jgi:hypothetical protein
LKWNIKAVDPTALTVFQAKPDMVSNRVPDEIAPQTPGIRLAQAAMLMSRFRVVTHATDRRDAGRLNNRLPGGPEHGRGRWRRVI